MQETAQIPDFDKSQPLLITPLELKGLTQSVSNLMYLLNSVISRGIDEGKVSLITVNPLTGEPTEVPSVEEIV